MIKRIPSGLYFVVMVLFFTPWWSAGCGQEKVVSLTGVQTITGFEVEEIVDIQLRTKKKRIPPDPFALAAAFFIVGALIVGWQVRRKNLFVAGGLGAASAVALLIFKARIDAAVLSEGKGLVRVVFENGYWTSVFLLFAAGLTQLFWAYNTAPEPEVSSAPKPTPSAESSSTEVPRKPRGVLIPTEPPPVKVRDDSRYMPPSMRAELEKQNRDQAKS